jgi:phosphohistidine phosphatase
MHTLVLLRHAKAEPDMGRADRERRLTAKGRLAAEAAAARMARGVGSTLERALVSSAARTQETWEIVQGALPAVPVVVLDGLYMASAEQIWQTAAESAAQACLVVGHNPGLHELAGLLLAQSHDHSALARDLGQRFPTAAFAAFSLTGDVLEAAGPRLLDGWLG